MDVSKENFDELLPEIINDINSCSFMAIDTELTGLWCNGEPRQLDSPEDYYKKFIAKASQFLCIQFGLSVFQMNSTTKRYQVKSYVFNVFPHQFYKSNYTFSCQASAIDFLVSQDFDFNKVFYNGISYLNFEREAELSEILQEKRFYKEKNASREMEEIEIPKDLETTVKEACDKLESVLNNDLDEDEVKVSGCNGYVRRLIYQTIKKRHPNGELLVETKDGCMVSRKANVEGKNQKTQLEIDEERIKKNAGISKVFRAMAKSGKLIVGHNMFLDLCHTVKNFLCDLPESYVEFKELMRCSFPLLLDTKYMSSCEGMQDLISVTILNSLYQRISSPPFSYPDIDIAEGHSYSENKFHNAGFDSFVTGISFLAMYNYLAKSKNTLGNPEFNPKSDVLKKFLNRIFLNSSDCHIYMSGNDYEPDRSHYFHVSFPKNWVMGDMIKLFSNHGRISVHWINDSSAWIGLQNSENAEACKAELCSNSSHLSRGVKVVQYYTHMASAASSTVDSRKRLSNAQHSGSPHHKKHKPSGVITISHGSSDTPEDNLLSRNESNAKERSRSEQSRTEDSSLKAKRSKSEGNGVDRRKSQGGQNRAIEELEKEMDADTSLKSYFGSSSW